MKKENIFDLYAAQHKDDPAPAADRVPGEVTPEDVAPPQEVPVQATEPKQDPTPDPPQDPEQKAPAATLGEGNENGIS